MGHYSYAIKLLKQFKMKRLKMDYVKGLQNSAMHSFCRIENNLFTDENGRI